MVQSQASKLSTKDLLKDLLDEIKGFEYQITEKVLLKIHKENESVELAPVYLNSTAKTAINSKYMLDKSFQESYFGLMVFDLFTFKL